MVRISIDGVGSLEISNFSNSFFDVVNGFIK